MVERSVDPVEHHDGIGIEGFLKSILDHSADGQGVDLRTGGEDVLEVRDGGTFVVVPHRVAEVERVSGIGQQFDAREVDLHPPGGKHSGGFDPHDDVLDGRGNDQLFAEFLVFDPLVEGNGDLVSLEVGRIVLGRIHLRYRRIEIRDPSYRCAYRSAGMHSPDGRSDGQEGIKRFFLHRSVFFSERAVGRKVRRMASSSSIKDSFSSKGKYTKPSAQ